MIAGSELDAKEAAELIEAYQAVFTSPAGIKVLRDLLEVSGFMTVFPSGADALTLAHQNGTRAVFAQVYGTLMTTERGREAMAAAFRPAT